MRRNSEDHQCLLGSHTQLDCGALPALSPHHGFHFFLFLVDNGRGLEIVGLKDLIAVQAAEVIDSIPPPEELDPVVRARLHKIRKIGLILWIRRLLTSPPVHFLASSRVLGGTFVKFGPPHRRSTAIPDTFLIRCPGSAFHFL